MIYYLGYRVVFSYWLPENTGYVYEDTIVMPESVVYKLIFVGGVTNETTQMAINYATRKIHQFIDNY